MKYTFLHKSHRAQRIATDPRWTNLVFRARGVARRRFYCDADGVLESMLYLPVEYTGIPRSQPVTLRVRLVREATRAKPADPTGYDERLLVDGSDGFARVRFFYKGEAEKGRRYYWQVQIVGAVNATVATATGTHYCQFWRR